MNEKTLLESCPFCGGNGHWQTEHDADDIGYFLSIKCLRCRAQSGQTFVQHGGDCPATRAEVRQLWNQRAASPSSKSTKELPFDSEYVCNYLEEVLEQATGNADPEVRKLLEWLASSSIKEDGELADLFKFYGVSTLADLADAQARHIEKLQAKLPLTPSLAPQRVREG